MPGIGSTEEAKCENLEKVVVSNDRESKRSKKGASPVLGFLDEDKIGTIQPHDDVLEITLRIGGFDVKRVLVD